MVACPSGALEAQDLYVDGIGHDYGAQEAAVRVVEFSDFGCHYCRQFHLETWDTLFEDYVASGRVRWKYVTFVSGMFAHSRIASIVAECVGEQGRFDAIRERVFRGQPDWKGAADPMPLLMGYAADVAPDSVAVRRCVEEGRTELRVDQGTRLGLSLGVRGTPTFVVDGFPMMGNLPLAFLRELLDRRLAAASARKDP